MIGQTLSHFQITDKLGEGGMGEVYRAQDTKLGREVAIKVLPEAVAGDSERLARFDREAKVLASLNHPNIGSIYGLEEAEGRQFLVLELVEGDTLADRMARGPLPVKETLQIARQIATALEAAHDRGIIHRDLKPANVKLTPEGKVKVLDFGLAKAWVPQSVSGGGPLLSQSPTLSAQMTEAGMLLGTAAYMSPEQARGKEVDKRADIWAFGCVVLEMLTGRKTFGGETVTDVIASVVAREPEWEALPAETPPALRRLLRRCLEKDPEQRLRDIAGVRIEIEEILAGRSGEVAVEAPAAARSWMVAAALAVATALVLAFFVWRLAAREERVVRAFVPAPEGTVFQLDAVSPGPVAVSPDGQRLAFSARSEEGQVQLWVRELDNLTARPLAGTDGAAYPFWSPDSRYLGFFTEGKLKKIEVTGGPPLTLCDASNGKGGTWNADGVIVFAPVHNQGLQRVSAAGGEPVPLTELDAERKETSHRHPRFLPDGRRFLYLSRVGTSGPALENNRLVVASLEDEEEVEIMPSSSNAEVAAGLLLFVRENTLMARPFDARRLELTGEAFPVAEDVVFFPAASLGVFSVSPGGVLAFEGGSVGTTASTLVWRDRSGQVLEEVGAKDRYGEVHLSPDGRLAAVSITDNESGNQDLWIWDLERQIKTRFTFDPAEERAVAWSPAGERMAFASTRGGQDDIYSKPVSGARDEELVYQDERNKYPVSWSPDGQHLLYVGVDPSPQVDAWALPLEGEKEPFKIQATDFVEALPIISTDGRWVAYVSNESGRSEVYVTAFPEGGRKWQVSTAGGSFPRWRRDGGEIFYVTEEGSLMAAAVDGSGATFRVDQVETLFEAHSMDGPYQYDVAADGQRFLINTPAAATSTPPLTLVVNWTADLPER